MSKEIFLPLKDVVECGDNYEVSNYGNVRNLKTGRIMKAHKCGNGVGYLQVVLSLNGEKKHITIHRLVALAFLPNPYNKREVNHKDGNKRNNLLSNLEWATSRENSVHAVETKLQPVPLGEDAANAKLSNVKVLKIRELFATGTYKHRELSEMFGVGRRTITQVVNRQTWTHI